MTHATSCDLLVRNGDCTCQTSHAPMRGVSETMRGYLRNTYSRTSWTLQVLDALEDTEAAWRRDAASLETLTAAVREYTDGPMHRSGNCGPCVLCRAI